MSTVMNEEVKICCKAVTEKMFTVVGLLVELSTYIEKPKGYIEASLSIRRPSVTVTYNSPVISSSLFSLVFFRSELQSHI